MRRIRFVVTGRVQGVAFRASTQREADRLGLGGFVRNRQDGAVEGEAEGDVAAIEQFQDWLGKGPSWARVEAVEVAVIEPRRSTGRFDIRG